MGDLFISYSSKDEALALSVLSQIEAGGISCWISCRDVAVGAIYQEEIVSAIENCRAVFLLLSINSNDSKHVLRELEIATNAGKKIYPINIDNTPLSKGMRYALANVQWMNNSNVDVKFIKYLKSSIDSSKIPIRRVSQYRIKIYQYRYIAVLLGLIIICLFYSMSIFIKSNPIASVRTEPTESISPAKSEAKDPFKELASMGLSEPSKAWYLGLLRNNANIIDLLFNSGFRPDSGALMDTLFRVNYPDLSKNKQILSVMRNFRNEISKLSCINDRDTYIYLSYPQRLITFVQNVGLEEFRFYCGDIKGTGAKIRNSVSSEFAKFCDKMKAKPNDCKVSEIAKMNVPYFEYQKHQDNMESDKLFFIDLFNKIEKIENLERPI